MSDESVLAMLDILEQSGTDYMVVGSLSVNAYTFPRSTQDADIVIAIEPSQVAGLLAQLRRVFRIEPQMSFETVTGTMRYIVDSLKTGFKIELFLLSNEPHDRARFDRRARVSVEGRSSFVATAEDVVITKLRWSRHGARSKDVDDARNVIASQADSLDWNYIHHWCDQHGTRALLDQIRASIPPI